MKTFFCLTVLAICHFCAFCQISATLKSVSEEQLIRTRINSLTDTSMHGRGYVHNGKENAAEYIQSKFRELKMRGITKEGSYVQSYYFPVNTFPGKMQLSLNEEDLVAGEDYIIDPASTSYYGKYLKVVPIDLKQVVDTAGWVELVNSFTNDNVYYFDEIETVCRNLNIREDVFPYILPHGCYLIKGKEKLTWSVKMDTCKATIFYVRESAIPKKWKNAHVWVEHEYVTRDKNQNIVGIVPGRIRDTFLVITSHYDHL